MGTLEPEFSRLHWPPLVRSVTQTVYYPGFRYEFFRSFTELDQYFTQLAGVDWRRESWAEFWIGQHKDTLNDDRAERVAKDRVMPYQRTGNRRDIKSINSICVSYLKLHPTISSYKLRAHLKSMDINVSQNTTWRIIKTWKHAPDKLKLDDVTGRYLSNAYLSDALTPLGKPIPEGYTKTQWRKDWNEKHGIG